VCKHEVGNVLRQQKHTECSRGKKSTSESVNPRTYFEKKAKSKQALMLKAGCVGCLLGERDGPATGSSSPNFSSISGSILLLEDLSEQIENAQGDVRRQIDSVAGESWRGEFDNSTSGTQGALWICRLSQASVAVMYAWTPLTDVYPGQRHEPTVPRDEKHHQ
jgi:hypothetical protein